MLSSRGNRLVLTFHGIGCKPSWIDASESAYWCDEPKRFEEILDLIPGASEGSGRSIELTFDDGNLSDFTIAAPALAARHLPASFFVCAGRIGKPGYVDRVALRDMTACGLRIGSHGWDHIDWRRADDRTLTREASDAKRRIEDITGQQVGCVAIPFGSYDRRVLAHLREFDVIYTSDRGLAPSGSRLVPRVSYTAKWTESPLVGLLSANGMLEKMERSLRKIVKRLR